MARIYGEIAASALMTFDKSFSRSNGQPLDSTEVFYSYAAAEAYALTDVAYVGQKIVVIETIEDTTTVAHYGVEADGSLKELGAIPVGDGLTVEVVDGKIQLASLEGHASGTYQPFLVDGKIEWREPSATTVEGLDNRLTSAENDIDALEGIVGNEAADGVEASGLVKAAADNAAAIEAVEASIGKIAEGKTVVEMISDAQTAATYDDTQVKADIKANTDAIAAIEADYLKSEDKYDDTELSGRVKVIEDDYLKGEDREALESAISAAEESAVDRILGYLAEEEVNASYDTLKEVAAWIESDTTASAELVTRISNIEKDYLKGADKTALEGEIDALGAYVGDLPEDAASETVVAYIQEVVDALKIGEYAKASELTALAERVTAAEGKIEILEGKAHEHENADVLNGISANQVDAWDAAEQNAKDYADGLNEALVEIVNGKVDAEEGKSLVDDTLITKLEGIEAGAQVNIIESVDEAQFGLSEAKHLTLLDIAIGKVTGLQDALDGKANKGTTLAEYGITDAYTKTETLDKIAEKITEINGGESAGEVLGQLNSYKETNDARVDTIEGKLSGIAEGAQVNVLEAVKINGAALEIVDKAVNIPVATSTVLGVVMSSAAENKVAVAADGTMEVNSLNVSKLVQGADDTLILDGGASK